MDPTYNDLPTKILILSLNVDAAVNVADPTWLKVLLFVIPENVAEFAVKGEFIVQHKQLNDNAPFPDVEDEPLLQPILTS